MRVRSGRVNRDWYDDERAIESSTLRRAIASIHTSNVTHRDPGEYTRRNAFGVTRAAIDGACLAPILRVRRQRRESNNGDAGGGC